MASFTVTIDCDNAAFEDPAFEIGRLLRGLVSRVEGDYIVWDTSADLSLVDANGNRVGSATWEPGE